MLWVVDNLLLDHVGLPQVVIVAVHLVRLLCEFPLGQKHSEIGFTVSQTGDFQKEEFQDLVNVAQYTGCPMSKISSFCNALLLP